MSARQVYDFWEGEDGKKYRIGVDMFLQDFRLMEKVGHGRPAHWKYIEDAEGFSSFADALKDAELFASKNHLVHQEIVGKPLWNVYVYPDATTCFLVRSKDGLFRLMTKEHKMFARAKLVSDEVLPPCRNFLDAAAKPDAFAKKRPYLTSAF